MKNKLRAVPKISPSLRGPKQSFPLSERLLRSFLPRNDAYLEFLELPLNKFGIFLFIFSLGLGICFAQKPAKSEEDVIKNAKQLFSEGEYAAALPLYSQLLSLHPKDPNFSYRFGACKLFSEKDKEAALTYLEFAVNDPAVEPEAFFFLGKAYHLNYRFNEALAQYKKFEETGDSQSKEELLLQRHIAMCENGKKLLKNVSDIVVIEKKTLSKTDFFRNYDLSEFGGKIIKTPDEFKLTFDLKRKKESIMYLQPNADVVYFSSYGEDGKNRKDIYFANKTPDGNWGKPQIVAGPINTEFDEDYPFIHPDGKTLYFASNGHNSMGGYDVFKSTFDEETQQWSYPQNIDFAINTPGDDYLYITDMDEKNAYFSSNRESSENEITVYRVNVERIPVDITVIKGIFIADATKSAKITIEDLKDRKIAGVFNTNGNSGEYVLTVPNGGKFKFVVEAAENPVTYSGLVDIPKQKTLKALKQEMQLVSDNGEQQLIIKNIFDEEATEEVSVLLAEIYKEKASLDVNVNEVKEEIPEEKTEPIAEIKTDSVIGEPEEEIRPALTIKPENISNEEIVKIAKEDAKNAQKEASDLRVETEIAYAIANEKNRLSAERAKEAEEYMTSSMYATADPSEKQQKMEKAKQLKKESKLYAEQAVAAFNLAREIEKVATEKQKEADIAFNYAQELENAAQQNTPEATAEKLTQLNESLQKQRSETPKIAYSDFQKQIEEKRKESEVQTKLAEKLQDDVKNLETDVATLKTAAASEKKKKDRERLEQQASILERDLPSMQSEAQTAKENAEKTQKELVELEKQESIVSSVVSQIKSSDKTAVANLNESDKSKLETEISSSEERIAKLAEELAADTGKTKEPLVSIVSAETKSDSSNTEPVSENSALAISETSEQIPTDYENYFIQKIETNESETDAVKKEETKATQYENWANAQEKEASELKQKAEQTTDETEKTTLNEKAISLENSAKEKRQIAQQSQETAMKLKSEKTVSTPETEEQVPTDYENYFKQKIEAAENFYSSDETVKKEEIKAKDYENWAKAQEKEAADLKQKAGQTTDETERNSLIEKSVSLENSAIEKRKLSQESEATVAQLRLNKPDSGQSAASANLSEEQKQNIAIYSEKYISTEKNAMNIQSEKDKNITLAEINKEWADEISKEIETLKTDAETIDDETKKSERKETIRLLGELKKEKETKANMYAEKAIETPALVEKQNPVVINESEIPTDYSPYFENKIQEQEMKKTTNSSEKEKIVLEENKAVYFESWANAIDKEIQKLKSESETISDEAEKRTVEEKIAKLETESKEKRDLSAQSSEQAKQIRQASPEIAAATETNTTSPSTEKAGTKESVVSLQDQIFIAKLDAYNMQEEISAETKKEKEIKNEEFNAELYKNWSNAIDQDVQQMKVLHELTESPAEKEKLEKIISESETASKQKKQLAKQSEENAMKLKEESVNAAPEISEEQIIIDVEKTEAAASIQQADSLQTEANLRRYEASKMGFFKKKKKAALLEQAQKTETESEIKKEKSELASERAKYIEQSAALKLNENMESDFAYKKLETRAKSLESDAVYLDDQAKATKDSLAIVKKKKLKNEIFVRASMLEQKAAAKREEAAKYTALAAEIKSKEESNFAAMFLKTIIEAEKKDSILPFAQLELSAEEKEMLKEKEEQKVFSAKRKEYKKLYLQIEVQQLESAKMRNEAGIQLTQFSSASASIDTIKDKNIRAQYIKDALEFAGQARTKLSTADSLRTNTKSLEKIADVKTRDAVSELYAINDMDFFRKVFAYQYLQPPDTTPAIAAIDTALKDTTPEIPEPVAIQETFTIGGSAPVYDDKNPIPLNPKYPDGLIWQVQIGAFRNPIPQNLFKGFAPVMGVLVSDGITRYSAGMFKTFSTANSARSEIVKLGYKDAFVVAYKNGQRISISEARTLIAKGLIEEGARTISDISSTPETTVGSDASNLKGFENLSGLYFTVQIGVYSKPANDAQLKNVKPVNSEKLDNGTIRYSSGVYSDFNAAANAKNKIVEMGIQDAFVTAYYNGKRVSIAEASRLSGNSSSGSAEQTTDNKQLTANETGIIFRVQLGKFNGDVPTEIAGIILDLSRNNGKVEKGNENIIYYSAGFKNFEEAENFKNDASRKGLTEAVVTAFNNEKIMDLEEAKKSAKNE